MDILTGPRAWATSRALAAAVVLALPLALAAELMLGRIVPDAATPLTPACAASPLPVTALSDAAPDEAALSCRLPSLGALPLTFAWDPKADGGGVAAGRIVAADMAARYGFAIPTVLMLIVAAPLIALAMIGAGALAGRRVAALTLCAAALGGVVALSYRSAFPPRLLVDLVLLRAARDPAYPFLTTDGWRATFGLLDIAFAAIMAAGAAAVVLFAAIALRPATPDADDMRRRALWMRLALGGASVMLALGVASAHGLMHWPAALLAPADAKTMLAMASTATLHWGVAYSTALALFAAPPLLALRLDEIRLAAVAPSDGHRLDLFDQAGLGAGVRRSALSLLAVALPAATGPGLDLLRAIFDVS